MKNNCLFLWRECGRRRARRNSFELKEEKGWRRRENSGRGPWGRSICICMKKNIFSHILRGGGTRAWWGRQTSLRANNNNNKEIEKKKYLKYKHILERLELSWCCCGRMMSGYSLLIFSCSLAAKKLWSNRLPSHPPLSACAAKREDGFGMSNWMR